MKQHAIYGGGVTSARDGDGDSNVDGIGDDFDVDGVGDDSDVDGVGDDSDLDGVGDNSDVDGVGDTVMLMVLVMMLMVL